MTIYKLFFDVEKLKSVLFNFEQHAAFSKIKVDLNSVMEDRKYPQDSHSLSQSLEESDDKISQALKKMLDQTR